MSFIPLCALAHLPCPFLPNHPLGRLWLRLRLRQGLPAHHPSDARPDDPGTDEQVVPRVEPAGPGRDGARRTGRPAGVRRLVRGRRVLWQVRLWQLGKWWSRGYFKTETEALERARRLAA